jgi:hypothetical protein
MCRLKNRVTKTLEHSRIRNKIINICANSEVSMAALLEYFKM